jgi:uncharacterized membrane protein
MAILPGFAFTLLTTGYNPTVSTLFQYNCHWIPYIFPASIVALRSLGGEGYLPSLAPSAPSAESAEGAARRRAALVTMLFLSVVTSYHFGALLQRNSFKSGFAKVEFAISPQELQRYHELREIVALIPPSVSLAATEHLAPHVSTRVSIYCFRDSIGTAEYVLFGSLDRNSKNTKQLKDLLTSGKLGIVAEKGGFMLFQRGASTARNAEIEKKL